MSASDLEELLVQSRAQDEPKEQALDRLRGRQVWLAHDHGLVTRYAHLEAIADGIGIGAEVRAGDTIGYVGDSGTPESIEAPGDDGHVHLHFEVRVGDSFLGAGLPIDEVRVLYAQAFSGPPAAAE